MVEGARKSAGKQLHIHHSRVARAGLLPGEACGLDRDQRSAPTGRVPFWRAVGLMAAIPQSACRLSATRYHHPLDQYRACMDVATRLEIAADGDDLLEHVLHVPGDGNFLDGELDLAVFDPVPGRAT